MIERILKLLDNTNMTAKELTEKLNIGKSSISEWKTGKTKPSTNSLIGISQIFNVSLDWLITGKEFDCLHNLPERTSPIFELTLDEETLLESYRDMTLDGKRALQKSAKNLWAEYRKKMSKKEPSPTDEQIVG